jgi:predicted PurR-regulated permease PerM
LSLENLLKKILITLVFILFAVLFYSIIYNRFISSYGFASSSAMLRDVKEYCASELSDSRQVDFLTKNKISYYLEINTNRFSALFSQSILSLCLLFVLFCLFLILLGLDAQERRKKTEIERQLGLSQKTVDGNDVSNSNE